MNCKDLKEVRILMLGEPGVGKTSLILSLVSEQFIDNDDTSFELPAKLESITIPAEVTLEKIPGILIDYSSREQSDQELATEIERANAICLVYAMNDEASKQKLATYWLPKIKQLEESLIITDSTSSVNDTLADSSLLHNKRSIVLVANKYDTNERANVMLNDPFIGKLIASHHQIETCIQCSAKTLRNVPEVFYYAQKSVLYPTGPVYDIDEQKLTQQAIRSLTRIFKLCDRDNDGVLNDTELNEFQLKCFGVHLNLTSLQEVKALLVNGRDNYLNDNEITLSGFLHLHALFIRKGRQETIWTVLKKFGYDRNLSLSREFSSINLKVPASCSVELSLKGIEFLHNLFKKHDKDKDDCLSREELDDLFSVCPISLPWTRNNTGETDAKFQLTYCGYFSQWMLTTYFDIKLCAELLACLGYNNYYDESQLSAFNVSRPKEIDILKKSTHRSVFLCYVYGRKKCGKTAFLQGLLGRDLQFQATLSRDEITRWTCNLVQFQNIEKYLILKEINSSDLEMHEVYPPDVVLLLYDITDPNSLAWVADIFINIYKDRPVPCLLVGTKCDQTELSQKYALTAEKFAEHYKLPPPQYFSASSSILPTVDIYAKIVAIATYPKMYPMRSQIWRFFQKLGAAAVSATSRAKNTNRLKRSDSRNSLLNPYTLFKNNSSPKKQSSFNDPDNMFLRYTLLTATCVTVAYFLIKLLK